MFVIKWGVADSEMTVVNFYSASLQRIEKRLRLGEDGKKREMNSLKFSLFMNRIAEMGFFVFVFCERNGDVENGKVNNEFFSNFFDNLVMMNFKVGYSRVNKWKDMVR